MSSHSRTAAIDPARTADLSGGWRVAVCVDENGNETCWLVAPSPGAVGCACRACAPHEQVDTDRRTPA